MNICVVGLGLIGGSMALAIKKTIPQAVVSGIDSNPNHTRKAQELNLVHTIIGYEDLNRDLDLIVVAIPVDLIAQNVALILDKVGANTLVIDTGSTKLKICEALKHHPKRNQFLATHQMAGTEYSGPEAAEEDLFEGRKNIVCQKTLTRSDLLKKGLDLFDTLNMQTFFMDPSEHDICIAYISHLSHISSFMLSNTVFSEETKHHILDMAGSGFASTVRLAKSDPQTWTSIFLENKNNILPILKEYIHNLEAFKKKLENRDKNAIFGAILQANQIKKYL